MALFKRKLGRNAVAEPDLPASAESLFEEIHRLASADPDGADPESSRRQLALRHRVGARLLEAAGSSPDYPAPDASRLPVGQGLPEFARDELTPGLLRAAILRDGCVLVRGLVDRAAAERLADGIDRAFAEREVGGHTGLYEEFVPEEPFDVATVRPWIQQGGGLLAADSPRVAAAMLHVFEAAGLPPLVAGYLGERPLISVHKTTLRRAEPTVGGAWHQDGAFMGGARALNLWLSLSRCGDVAPGLDIVPRRLDEIVIAHDTMLDVEHTRARAREAAGDIPILRPIFEPGDALLFDEMFLHQTATDPSMTEPRFAIESWFFGASAFPPDYAPLAV